jgi:choline dehydrogenase-like flavoprotein
MFQIVVCTHSGGAGGCVAAQSMVENGKKVLLIERGGEPTKSTKADVYTVLNKKANKCIETFDGDGVVLGTGNCLGGATTYNQGIWIEEQADFLNDYGGLFTKASVQSAFNYVSWSNIIPYYFHVNIVEKRKNGANKFLITLSCR